MNGQLSIRPANREDQPALLDIIWQTVLVDPVGNAEVIANPEVVELPLEQLEPTSACVAELDGMAVGFAVVLPRPDGAAELDGLFVSPIQQRGGIGRALMVVAKDLALAQGAGTLHVVANPGATDFYRAVGFADAGETKTQFGPAPLMKLTLRADD